MLVRRTKRVDLRAMPQLGEVAAAKAAVVSEAIDRRVTEIFTHKTAYPAPLLYRIIEFVFYCALFIK